MSYKLKTLIVFDTNSLRSTEAGEVAYSFFAFGRPFQVIEEFIMEKNLTDDIHIAIPTWAIEELKDQKQRQYKTDIVEFQKLAKRLSGLPHIPEITLPEEEFDCATYVEGKALAYLATKQVKLLEIKEEIANTVLRSMMTRVMKDERDKQPFVHAKKGNKTYKDAGFKDNLIWESLLHFDEVANYDKVIFVTGDGDYSGSGVQEFRTKWNKHFTVFESELNVIADLQKDYELYITERAIYEFAQTPYFKDYLFDELKQKTEILFEEESYKIENFEIMDTCSYITRIPPNDHMIESFYIDSEIKIHFTVNGEKKQQIVKAITSFADEETKEIIETFYDINLI